MSQQTNPNWPAIQPDIYGPLISAAYVRRAMTATIDLWSPYYIYEVAARFGLTDDMRPFEHWSATYDQRAMPAGMEAAFWVTSPQTDPRNPPQLQGNGLYIATWLADVNIAARGGSWDQTSDLLDAYALVVRALVAQHRSLGQKVSNTAWVAEGYRQVEPQARRTTGAAIVRFSVKVDGVTNVNAGPKTIDGGQPNTTQNPPIDDVIVQIVKTGVD